jgi:hypothetical protein
MGTGKIPLSKIVGKLLINNIKHLPTGRGSTYPTPFYSSEGWSLPILEKNFYEVNYEPLGR